MQPPSKRLNGWDIEGQKNILQTLKKYKLSLLSLWPIAAGKLLK
jgi:hypothetical protein